MGLSSDENIKIFIVSLSLLCSVNVSAYSFLFFKYIEGSQSVIGWIP